MLTNSLIPFAFERGKQLAALATRVCFCLTTLNTREAFAPIASNTHPVGVMTGPPVHSTVGHQPSL
jgi:hypothetical protein